MIRHQKYSFTEQVHYFLHPGPGRGTDLRQNDPTAAAFHSAVVSIKVTVDFKRGAPMFQLLLIVLLALAATAAPATFELEDPAKKIMEDTDETKKEPTLGEMSCARFVTHRENHSDTYFTTLKWLIRNLDEAAPGWPDLASPDDMTRWIDRYCRENPGKALGKAVDHFLESVK
jgi:hypothetical protein